jgi:hypothetical protein
MTPAEKLLCWLLRVIGAAAILALPCALMPDAWMDATHQWLGLGTLPTEPIVGYLARSLSLFYAMFGGMLWVFSYDPYGYRAAIRYLAVAVLMFGLLMLWVDFTAGMPLWWSLSEGPFNVVFAGAILALSQRTESRHRNP